MRNPRVDLPSLNQWTPCSLRYTVPHSQYILIIFSLGGIVPLGLLQQAYYETLAAIQRQIEEGHGDETPEGFNIQDEDITPISVQYTRERSPDPPTNRDLIEVFLALRDITADRDYPMPNPPFSRETKFGLASVNGPDWVGYGAVELVETDGDLFAPS